MSVVWPCRGCELLSIAHSSLSIVVLTICISWSPWEDTSYLAASFHLADWRELLSECELPWIVQLRHVWAFFCWRIAVIALIVGNMAELTEFMSHFLVDLNHHFNWSLHGGVRITNFALHQALLKVSNQKLIYHSLFPRLRICDWFRIWRNK